MPLKVFIDTEFSDFIETELISIGLAAESGEVFYAEVPFDRKKCSSFVNEVVIPLLNPELAACSADSLRDKLHTWLRLVRPSNEELEICFDYHTDWDLFYYALGDYVPAWCRPRAVARNINELLRYEFHKKNDLPEHHALNDAMAMRHAFRERLYLSQ